MYNKHKDMELEKILKNLGFVDSEISIYKSLINSGELGVSQLSRVSGIKRTLVYHAAKKLIENGLIIEFEKNKNKYFKVTNPDNLVNLVETKKQSIEKDFNVIEELIPSLNQKYISQNEQPLVDTLIGISGLKKIYKLINAEADEVLIFASSVARKNIEVDILIKRQIDVQEKKGIKVRSIVKSLESKLDNLTPLDLKDKKNVEIRALPPEEFLSETQIFIWKDTVAFNTTGEEMISTIVKNKKIFQTFKLIFNALWDRLPHTEKIYVTKNSWKDE